MKKLEKILEVKQSYGKTNLGNDLGNRLPDSLVEASQSSYDF